MKDFIIPDHDFGTPAAKSKAMVTLTIDGFDVTVPEGTSIMRAAAEVGISVPKLCATDSIDAFGSCRLCLVEIDGRNGTPASCTTPVAAGISVHTQTARLQALRRGVMELYASDHPVIGLADPANGDSELQRMAGIVGLRDMRYRPIADHVHERKPDGAANPGWQPVDVSNPYFAFDSSKCIVCSLCVRACDEVQGTFALTIEGRGFESRVSAGMKLDDFLSSDCVSCGACVQVCPTGSLQEKSVKELGLPERSVITTCAYCGVGCSFKAEMRGDELVRMTPYKHGKANRGHSCVKGRFAYGYASHKDRILNPMIRDSINDPWQEVSWAEAMAFAAQLAPWIERFPERCAVRNFDAIADVVADFQQLTGFDGAGLESVRVNEAPSAEELLLRVRAILRRESWYRNRSLGGRQRYGEHWVDFENFCGEGPAGPFQLGVKECMILKQLMERYIPLANWINTCLLYTSPSPRDGLLSRMPSSA